MKPLAIRVQGLSKRYRIGARAPRYRTLRDTLAEAVAGPWRRAAQRWRPPASEETVWALRDVTFEVSRGEVVGIVGRNGAGKSTLLNVLSRITEPTEGFAEIAGRIGSLLEVGTGFHPELTGRENIYLNGAILGMRRGEIGRKFDEIVEFAEVARFIDTPVKHYSSGMGLRLAFAVAAHLEPEILLVDEVLAVGDAQFQKKCLNKMAHVGQQGRTVLFVSHNMPVITGLCNRAFLLEEGRVAAEGPASRVVASYLRTGLETTAAREWQERRAPGGEVARLRAVRVRSGDDQIVEEVDVRKPFRIEMEYEVLRPGFILFPNLTVYNEQGLEVFWTQDLDPAWRRRRRSPGRYVATVWIPGNLLSPGIFSVGFGMETVTPTVLQFWEPEAVVFQVMDVFDGTQPSARADFSGEIGGIVRPLLRWTNEFTPVETLSGT